jgi:hypothetical protein
MAAKRPTRASSSRAVLARRRVRASRARTLGSRPPATSAGEHGAAGDPEAVAGDHRQLGLGVPGQLRPPAASFAVRTATRSAR